MATKEEVLKVAALARIRVQDSELEDLQKKFTAVLDSFKFLSEANTEGVVPLYHGIEQMTLREDLPEAPLSREELLRNAPDSIENCFRIPRVLGAVE